MKRILEEIIMGALMAIILACAVFGFWVMTQLVTLGRCIV